MGGSPRSRAEAQHRADRIRAFQEELAAAIRDGAADLTPDQLARLAEYHDTVLADLARRFDVDVTPAQKRAALGMRIATLIGAFALAASLVLYLARTWGHLPVAAQVGVLASAPLLSLAALEIASRRRATNFLSDVLALVSFAAFVVNVEMLGQVFALAPTPEALLAYGAFAAALAYAYGQRLLLMAGALCLVAWLAADIVRLTGAWWAAGATERPESWLPGAVALLAWAHLPHPVRDTFPSQLRGLAVTVAGLALFVIGRNGYLTWLPAEPRAVAATYQVMLFAVAAAAIGGGIARRWTETAALGCVFFIAALFTKFYDWWWVSMPHYLFFLLVGVASLGLLWLFERGRRGLRQP
jgi:hypothetical protein